MIIQLSILGGYGIYRIVKEIHKCEENTINEIISHTKCKNDDGLYPMVKKLNDDYFNIIIPTGIDFESVKKLEPIIGTALKRDVLISNDDFRYNLTFVKYNKFEKLYPIEIIKHNNTDLTIPIGYGRDGKLVWINLTKNPNLLVSGLVNSGKSLFVHNFMLQVLNNYDCEFTLIDLKAGVELIDYQSLKVTKEFVYRPTEVLDVLDDVETLIETRLHMIRDNGCRNMIQYNKTYPNKKLKYHIVMFEELMAMGKDKKVMAKLKKCLSISRAVGVYFVITSQRFDADTIDGAVKANFDLRLTFRVASEVDSRVILGCNGAEKIKDKGRCLLNTCGEISEVQCFYVDTEKLELHLNKFDKVHKKYSKNIINVDKDAYNDSTGILNEDEIFNDDNGGWY